ncbi:MAG: hypothetical protein NUW01_09690 [Gemmatimonadaceae bacterium]|nr:hypothetical protein [Gemmatimonadaceae bacterium]
MPKNRNPLRVVTPAPVVSQPPDLAMMGVHIFNDAARGIVISRVWAGKGGSRVDEILEADLPDNVKQGVARLLDRLENIPVRS